MSSETGSLLIVDDNAASCEMLARGFRERGYSATVSRDGRQALELLRDGGFDLILLDITMPGADGFAVLRAVRAGQPPTALPVIMATAHDRSTDIVHALELGANDYVVKPYDFPVILARARTQLALKRMVEEQTRLERSLAQRNEELAQANRQLGAAYTSMKRDLHAAARIQEALLPHTLPRTPGARFAWGFQPCEELAGDTLNVVPLDRDHVGLYVLDVSGHGVAAALLSVTLSQLLSPARDASSVVTRAGDGRAVRIVPPAKVAEHLNRRFPWNPDTEQYFTLVYGVLDTRTGDFRYVSAAHPGLVWLPADGRATVIERPSLPIGIGDTAYEEHTLRLDPGSRLYLYSDGVTDAMSAEGERFGERRLLHALEDARTTPLTESVSALLATLHRWSGTGHVRDDVSVLALEVTGRRRRVRRPGRRAAAAQAQSPTP